VKPLRSITGTCITLSSLLLAMSFGLSATAQTTSAAVLQGPDPVVRISAVSPWVNSNGEFQVRFAPSVAVPAGSQLTFTVHQALQPTRTETLRDKVDAVMNGASPGRVLQSPETRLFSEYGDPTTGSVLTIPIRSTADQDRTRLLLPKAGIHPVELVLTSPDGPEIWSQLVFLNRLPTNYSPKPHDPSAVAVTLLIPIETAPSLDTSGAPVFTIEERARIDAATTLFKTVPDAPLRLGLRPNTLDGLVRSKEPWAENFVTSLSGALSSAGLGTARTLGPSVLSLPYVHVSTSGLIAAGATGDLERELILGDRVTREVTDRRSTQGTWALDDSLSPEAAFAVGTLGAKNFLVSSEQLERPSGLTEQQTMTAAVQLGKDSGLRAIAYDTLISQRFANSLIDPAIRAHEVISLMLSAWFSARSPGAESFSAAGATLGSVVLLPPNIDPAAISALDPSLLIDGPIQVLADGASLGPASETKAEPVAELLSQVPPDESMAVSATAETRRQIGAYRTMTSSPESEVELWTRLNAQTLATQLNPPQRFTIQESVRSQLAKNLSEIELPPGRQVTITGRSTTIPLRFRNNLPYEVRVKMSVRSTRLNITGDADREVVLAPGENRIDLAVTVRAPGESLLRIKLLSPDDELEIGQSELPVRSAAISGVGAALSVISILFLMLWWGRTHRRRKRETARISGDHPALLP